MKRTIFYIFLILTFSTACQTANPTANRQRNTEEVNEATAIYLDAVKERILNNKEKAAELLHEVLEKDPAHAPANYDLARIEKENNNWPQAEQHIRKAVTTEPDNKWYKIELAEILRNQQKVKESIAVYEEIIDQFDNNPQLYYQIAMMYLYQEDYRNALRYYDKIEDVVGVNERLTIQKQKLYMQLGEKQEAIEELKKLIENQPRNPKFYNLLANLYIAEKQYEKAEEVYRKVKEIAPEDAYVHINLADLYRKQDRSEDAFQELRKGFRNPELSLDSKIQILKTYYSVSEMYSAQKAQAMSLAETLVTTHPDDSRARSIYGDFLYRDNSTNEAGEQFKQAIALDSSRFYNWERYMSILLEQSAFKEVKKYSTAAMDLFPMQPVLYLYAGLANLQLEHFTEAKEQLERGKSLVAGNEALKTQFSIYLGEVYHELKDYEKSDKFFEQAIKNDPKNSFTLNNYSYYLSLRGEKLKAAEKYAQKAIELDPDNANNQDTYGWVLFTMGRYEEARFWIEKAKENSENPSGTVIEHLGDVYYELGKKEKAVELWKKAREIGETTEEIDRKIENKKRLVE